MNEIESPIPEGVGLFFFDPTAGPNAGGGQPLAGLGPGVETPGSKRKDWRFDWSR